MTDQTAAVVFLGEDEPFVWANTPRSYWATPRVRKPKPANSPCLCGCGHTPNKAGSRFLPGHDGRHKGVLLGQAHAGDEAALAALVALGWGHFFVPRKPKG